MIFQTIARCIWVPILIFVSVSLAFTMFEHLLVGFVDYVALAAVAAGVGIILGDVLSWSIGKGAKLLVEIQTGEQ